MALAPRSTQLVALLLVALCICQGAIASRRQPLWSVSRARQLLQDSSDDDAAPAPAPAVEEAETQESPDDAAAAPGPEQDPFPPAVTVDDKVYLEVPDFKDHRGVWHGLAEQYPESVWAAFFVEGAAPDCSANKSVWNYDHFKPYNDEQFLIITGSDTDQQAHEVAHRGVYSSHVVDYADSTLQIVELEEGEKFCKHWQPYINLRTGELYAESVTMAMWVKENATAPAEYIDLSCEVAGDEQPGCYTGEVARTEATTERIKARSQARRNAGKLAERPEGAIVSVSRATFQCVNGYCGAAAPRLQAFDRKEAEAEE